MKLNRTFKLVDSEICEGSFPCEISVFSSEDDVAKHLIPNDRILIWARNESSAVLLSKGTNVLVVRNKFNKILKKQLISESGCS
jgi:hypothetical protein